MGVREAYPQKIELVRASKLRPLLNVNDFALRGELTTTRNASGPSVSRLQSVYR